MSLPYGEVNVGLFQKIKAKILEEPRSFNMRSWGWHLTKDALKAIEDILPPEKQPLCGTSACIAGWALAIDHTEKGNSLVGFDFDQPAKAARLLGLAPDSLPEDQLIRRFADNSSWPAIFDNDNWPEPFKQRYKEACDDQAECAKIAAEFIDYICGEKADV